MSLISLFKEPLVEIASESSGNPDNWVMLLMGSCWAPVWGGINPKIEVAQNTHMQYLAKWKNCSMHRKSTITTTSHNCNLKSFKLSCHGSIEMQSSLSSVTMFWEVDGCWTMGRYTAFTPLLGQTYSTPKRMLISSDKGQSTKSPRITEFVIHFQMILSLYVIWEI